MQLNELETREQESATYYPNCRDKTMKKQTESKAVIRTILLAAYEEYSRDGKISTVKCDACGGLLEITRLGDTALTVRCRCGRFEDTMRGL